MVAEIMDVQVDVTDPTLVGGVLRKKNARLIVL
jgi:hypothetical protein